MCCFWANETFSRLHHKLAPFIYMCFYNTSIVCSNLSINKMLVQSLIWCWDDIVTHCNDWSLYYNVNTTSYQWLINISLTFHHVCQHHDMGLFSIAFGNVAQTQTRLLKCCKSTYTWRGQVCYALLGMQVWPCKITYDNMH